MRENKFKPVKDLFFDYLKQEGDKINEDFANVKCTISANFPPNDEPEYGYFLMYIDCVLENAHSDKADLLTLGISIYDQTKNLEIVTDISWGHPSGKIVDSIFKKPVEVTEEHLNTIKEKLPNLILKLRETIRENPNGI